MTEKPGDAGEQVPERIAVLGGGSAAIAAVFAITDHADWQQRYDITVYERGWRLGGKGASGVNQAPGFGRRIEEHGLHVWSGFYENAFWLMRRCYAELDRPSSAPLATWDSAFLRHDYGGFKHEGDDGWYNWSSYLPHAPGLPGDLQTAAIEAGAAPAVERDASTEPGDWKQSTPWDYFRQLLPWSMRYLQSAPKAGRKPTPGRQPVRVIAWLFGDGASRRLLGFMKFVLETLVAALAVFLLRIALYLANLDQSDGTGVGRMRTGLLKLLLVIAGLWIAFNFLWKKQSADKRRSYILADTAIALMRGMLDRRILTQGFSVVDDENFKDWLARHGAKRETLASGTVRAIYSYLFAFENGDYGRPRIAAGVGVRMTLRLLLSSRGSVFWKMQAGMGDAVFAPLYEVLRDRGVKFRFFHRVLEMSSADGERVDRIRFGRQADLKGGSNAAYEPLVDVGGLPCWPSAPRYEQLVQGEALALKYADKPCDLDSAYTDWPDADDDVVIERGDHFETVLLGISVGALPYLCPDLIARDTTLSLKKATERLGTAPTQSVQLWMNRDLSDLGWKLPPPVLTAYAPPLDTWADMSHLLAREAWSREAGIRSLAYLVGPLDFPAHEPGPKPGVLDAAHEQVRQNARRWLDKHAAGYWPAAAPPGNPAGLDLATLGGEPRQPPPPDYFDEQCFRANIDPSERYVLSLPGTTDARPRTDGTRFRNLYLAGDWIDTGLNYGCVESAVIGGFRAAQALCGRPAAIFGAGDFPADAQANRATNVAPAPYVRRGGIHTMPPPWIAKNVDMYVFYLRCDTGALQDICDRCLNRPSGGAVAYEPTTKYVLLTYQHFPELRTGAGGYESIGYSQENEAAFWMFVRDRKGSGLPGGNDWSTFVPYMFTDDPIALLTGREVYGFPKELASVSLEQGTPPFQVHAHAFRTGNPAQPIRPVDLLHLTAGDVSRADKRVAVFSGGQGDERIYNTKLKQYLAFDELEMLKQFFDLLLRRRLDYVFLKEFRAIAGGEHSDHAAIGLAHQQDLKMKLEDLLIDRFRFKVSDFPSHPFVDDLGLRLDAVTGDLNVSFAVNVRLDFSFMPGKVLVDVA